MPESIGDPSLSFHALLSLLACSSVSSFKTVIDRYHKMNNIARYNNLLTFNHR